MFEYMKLRCAWHPFSGKKVGVLALFEDTVILRLSVKLCLGIATLGSVALCVDVRSKEHPHSSTRIMTILGPTMNAYAK